MYFWVRSACLSAPKSGSFVLFGRTKSFAFFESWGLASQARSFQSKIVALARAAIEEKSVEVIRLRRRTVPTFGPMDRARANQFINGSEKQCKKRLEGDFVPATRTVATLA
jgi:hypothetical protein